ncbi:helix-turn-helix domain-containing protein [Patescibacteria group bacterium]|nr:helix-turn-helix domain-containing protein [Patescibacteria group bacterium]
MKQDIIIQFKKRLKALREEYGYTQEQLSELSGIDYKHIQKLESLKIHLDIKLTTIEKLAKAFKLSVAEFLEF